MRNQPTGVMVLSIIHAVVGVPWVLAGIYLLMATSDAANVPLAGAALAKYILPLALVSIAVAAGYFATAWGLWQMRDWARAAAMAIAVLVLLPQVAVFAQYPSLFNYAPTVVILYALAEIGIIVYLLMPETTQYFVASGTMNWDTGPVPASNCPHCNAPGILPGMTVCPYCRQSLTMIPPYQEETLRTDPPPEPISVSQRTSATKLSPPRAPSLAWVIVKSGPSAGQRFDLAAETQIGRGHDCQIRLDDEYVSRTHARIKFESGQFFIYDVGSSAGTYVNDRKVQRLMLYDGTQIRLGETTLEFKRTGGKTPGM